MTSRTQFLLCLLLALCLLVLFLMPVAAAPISPLRGRHSLRPFHPDMPLVGLPSATGSLAHLVSSQRLSVRHACLAARAPDRLDLTSARLC